MLVIPFIKMEGCGNDYIFVDVGLGANPARLESADDIQPWVSELSDRHRGVGGDGVILLEPGTKAPVRMRMWNADGSEGRLCLNGLRCAAKYVAETTDLGDSFVVETKSGDHLVRVFRGGSGTVDEVEVEAGVPDFKRQSLPAKGTGDELWGERFYVGGMDLLGYGVSVGNPHLILWMDEDEAVMRAPLEEIGEPFDADSRFPEGVNVHLVSAENGRGLLMRSWERGTGITQACGSGAVGAYAVAERLGAVPADAPVQMPGGTVRIFSRESDVLIMRGPAREVFRGEWTPGS